MTLFNGEFRPVEGQNGSETAVEGIDERSTGIVDRRDGRVTQVIINALSDDGDTIRNEYVRFDAERKITRVSYAVYERIRWGSPSVSSRPVVPVVRHQKDLQRLGQLLDIGLAVLRGIPDAVEVMLDLNPAHSTSVSRPVLPSVVAAAEEGVSSGIGVRGTRDGSVPSGLHQSSERYRSAYEFGETDRDAPGEGAQ